MLRALAGHRQMLAIDAQREDGPFFCPGCCQPVILKQGRTRAAHFAHQPESICTYQEQGESEEHREAKLAIYQALSTVPGVANLQLEHYLQDVRPDLFFCYKGSNVAIEVQLSTLSIDLLERRTLAYASKHVAVLWTPPLPSDVDEERYAPRDWERYLHGLYYGRVYYWTQGQDLQPISFKPYWLAPSLYASERRSKRFVTPVWQPAICLTELAPVWRNAWGQFPHAKLWCQRYPSSL